MKYKECVEVASSLRQLADFLETEGPKLPLERPPEFDVTCNITKSDYKPSEDTGEYGYQFNEVATKDRLARFMAAVKTFEKEDDHSTLRLIRKFGEHASIEGYVSKQLTCEKRPTGRVIVHPSYTIPTREEEEYEWVCDENLSLLRLVENV